jgi:hypothetical protein
MNKVMMTAILLVGACASQQTTPQRAWTPADGNSFVVRNVRAFDGSRVHEGVDVVVASLPVQICRSLTA